MSLNLKVVDGVLLGSVYIRDVLQINDFGQVVYTHVRLTPSTSSMMD